MGSLLIPLNGFDKFYTGLIVCEAMIRSNVFGNISVFKNDIKNTMEILKCFFLPHEQFKDIFLVIKGIHNKFL